MYCSSELTLLFSQHSDGDAGWNLCADAHSVCVNLTFIDIIVCETAAYYKRGGGGKGGANKKQNCVQKYSLISVFSQDWMFSSYGTSYNKNIDMCLALGMKIFLFR